MSDQSASIRLSTQHKGRRRREPVWIARYRVVGKDSANVLGKAWVKRSRAPEGYMTRGQAEEAFRSFFSRMGRPSSERRASPIAVERYDLEDDVSIASKRAKTRRATSDKISFYSPDEVMRLVHHAENDQAPRCS